MNCEEILFWNDIYLTLLILCTLYMMADLIGHGYDKYKRMQTEKLFKNYKPDPETLTCYRCASRDKCPYVDDAYNTNGDCLANK